MLLPVYYVFPSKKVKMCRFWLVTLCSISSSKVVVFFITVIVILGFFDWHEKLLLHKLPNMLSFY